MGMLDLTGLPMQGEEPEPLWMVLTPLALAVGLGAFYLIRYLRNRRK